MIVSVGMICMVLALVCAVLAAFNAGPVFAARGPNWLGLGFAFFVLSFLARAVS